MAKAKASGDRFIERTSATGVKLRDYAGAVGVAATGVLGFSLLCILAGIAMADPNVSTSAAIAPMDIVDSAFSNINTVSAPTFEAIARLISTPTILPTDTAVSTPTLAVSNTPIVFPTFAYFQPTSTRRPRLLIPTKAPTSRPAPTKTDIPPTDIPPTEIPPTDIPPTDIPPTDIPPTDIPPTDIPPTDVPPPPTSVPPEPPIVPTPMP